MSQIKLLVITLLSSSFVFLLMTNIEAHSLKDRSSSNLECPPNYADANYPIPDDPLPFNLSYFYYDLSFFNGYLLTDQAVLSGHSTIIDLVCVNLLSLTLNGTIEFPTLNFVTGYKLHDGHFLSLPNGTWVDVAGEGWANISIEGATVSATAKAHVNLVSEPNCKISNLSMTLDNLDSFTIRADNFTVNGQLVDWSLWNQDGVDLVNEYFDTYKFQVEAGMEQLTNLILSTMTIEQICDWLYPDEEFCGVIG